jgi:hypothetical protein
MINEMIRYPIRAFNMYQVRQMQQSTGAIIKLPEDSHQTSANEIPVQIVGNFQASQVNTVVRSFVVFAIRLIY